MNRALVATGAAIVLAAASFSIPANAQMNKPGGGGGGGAPAAHGGGPSGGNAGAANRGGGGGGGAFRGGVQSGGHAMPNRGAFNGPRGNVRGNAQAQVNPQFRGNHRDQRRHSRRAPSVAFGFAGPNFYDYSYDTYPLYSNDECLQVRRVWTNYGWRNMQVNVCTDNQYQYQYPY